MAEQSATIADLEAQLLATTQIADEGFWDYQVADGTHVWSAKLYTMLGLEDDFHPTAESFLALIHPEDRERVDRAIYELVRNRASYDQVFRIAHPRRGWLTTRARGQGEYDADGRARRVFGALTDLTDVAEVVQRHDEMERRFNDLARNIPGAIFRYIVHPDGSDEIEYMSPGCFGIWEISDAEIQGDPSRLWASIDP